MKFLLYPGLFALFIERVTDTTSALGLAAAPALKSPILVRGTDVDWGCPPKLVFLRSFFIRCGGEGQTVGSLVTLEEVVYYLR